MSISRTPAAGSNGATASQGGKPSSEWAARRSTSPRAAAPSAAFVEFYADTSAKPVKTLKSIDEENERLRSLVTKLQDRVATLEVIATDPAERTAREIEALRELPSPSGDDDRR